MIITSTIPISPKGILSICGEHVNSSSWLFLNVWLTVMQESCPSGLWRIMALPTCICICRCISDGVISFLLARYQKQDSWITQQFQLQFGEESAHCSPRVASTGSFFHGSKITSENPSGEERPVLAVSAHPLHSCELNVAALPHLRWGMVEQSYSPHGEPDTETAQSEPCSGPEGRAARIQRMPSLICCCTHVNCIWKDPHGREVRSTSLPSVSQSNEVDGEEISWEFGSHSH